MQNGHMMHWQKKKKKRVKIVLYNILKSFITCNNLYLLKSFKQSYYNVYLFIYIFF